MSESTPTAAPAGALTKRKRQGVEKRLACSLKPPSLVEDTENEDAETGEAQLNSFVTYIDDSTRNEVSMPCTKAVYRKVTGDPKPGRKTVKSLDYRLGVHFLLAVEPVAGKPTVTGIDILPEIEARKFGLVPDDQAEIEHVTIGVNQLTGEMEVKSVPPNLTKRTLLHIMSAIDREEHLYPGQRLGGRHEVVSVSGNQVTIDPVGAA